MSRQHVKILQWLYIQGKKYVIFIFDVLPNRDQRLDENTLSPSSKYIPRSVDPISEGVHRLGKLKAGSHIIVSHGKNAGNNIDMDAYTSISKARTEITENR